MARGGGWQRRGIVSRCLAAVLVSRVGVPRRIIHGGQGRGKGGASAVQAAADRATQHKHSSQHSSLQTKTKTRPERYYSAPAQHKRLVSADLLLLAADLRRRSINGSESQQLGARWRPKFRGDAINCDLIEGVGKKWLRREWSGLDLGFWWHKPSPTWNLSSQRSGDQSGATLPLYSTAKVHLIQCLGTQSDRYLA